MTAPRETKLPTTQIKTVVAAVSVKDALAKTAKRLLRDTDEYHQALKERAAREWLEAEAQSFAEAAYALLLQRVEEHSGIPEAETEA